MSKSTTRPVCAYVLDPVTFEVCGDDEVDLYRSAIMVCEQHRFHLEYEARQVAERHYRWIEREYDDEYYGRLRDDWRAERGNAQRVYYLECGEYIKIGVSDAPEMRTERIKRVGGVLSPRGLDLSSALLLATEGGGKARESEMHQRFAHLREVGEWFRRGDDLLAHVAAI